MYTKRNPNLSLREEMLWLVIGVRGPWYGYGYYCWFMPIREGPFFWSLTRKSASCVMLTSAALKKTAPAVSLRICAAPITAEIHGEWFTR
jgi:hypothetical protein